MSTTYHRGKRIVTTTRCLLFVTIHLCLRLRSPLTDFTLPIDFTPFLVQRATVYALRLTFNEIYVACEGSANVSAKGAHPLDVRLCSELPFSLFLEMILLTR